MSPSGLGTFTDRITDRSGLEGAHEDPRRQLFMWMVPQGIDPTVLLTPCSAQGGSGPEGPMEAVRGQFTALCAPPAAHPAVPPPERPTATVSPLRTPSSPSRLPAAAVRPHPAVSPQHGHQPPAPGARPLIPLTSAAAAITPPNVSAAHLNGDGPPAPGAAGKPEERKNEKVRAAGPLPGLLLLPHRPPTGLLRRRPAKTGVHRQAAWASSSHTISTLHLSPHHHLQHCCRVTCSQMANKVEWAEFVRFFR